MARRKNAPESIRIKQGLSDRLRGLRTEFYGDRGGPDLARTLGIPVRTWYNYENGVTVPAEIILRIVELTSVEPVWLLRGEGPKLRPKSNGSAMSNSFEPGGLADSSVATLLRTALERLEQKERDVVGRIYGPTAPGSRDEADSYQDDAGLVLFDADADEHEPPTPADGRHYVSARGEWIAARPASGYLRVANDSMSPIVAEGAKVAYGEAEPASQAFHDRLVVAWIGDEPIVRWFQHCGRFALLRAENQATPDPSILVDLEGDGEPRFHRVLWISTPH